MLDSSPTTRGLAPDDHRWAELADRILAVAHQLQLHGGPVLPAALTSAEGTVLRMLIQEPGISSSAIAAATGIKRPNVSAALRGLERKGLAERRGHPHDGRGVTVRPTERGVRLVSSLRGRRAALIRAALQRAACPGAGDATTVDAVVELLRSLQAGLGAAPR